MNPNCPQPSYVPCIFPDCLLIGCVVVLSGCASSTWVDEAQSDTPQKWDAREGFNFGTSAINPANAFESTHAARETEKADSREGQK